MRQALVESAKDVRLMELFEPRKFFLLARSRFAADGPHNHQSVNRQDIAVRIEQVENLGAGIKESSLQGRAACITEPS